MSQQPLLFVFGQLDWLDSANSRRRVSGPDLFDDLAKQLVWFSARLVSGVGNTPALFYLKGTGVVARATVESSSSPDARDAVLLARYGLERYFRTKFVLTDLRRFEPPIDLRPLIAYLDFISNKGSHWGTSLRATPRRISQTDFKRILARQPKLVTAPSF